MNREPFSFVDRPEYVGAWNWPEARFYMQCEKKPNAFHRLMWRWFFGMRWIDGDAPWNVAAKEPL